MGICGDINGPASILRQLHGMLECGGPLSERSQVQAVFSTLTGSGNLEPGQIAEALGVEPSRIVAWATGFGIPPKSEWPSMIHKVMTLIDRVLREEYPGE
jgi:hypothetical protein